jgi:hypothetical protein
MFPTLNLSALYAGQGMSLFTFFYYFSIVFMLSPLNGGSGFTQKVTKSVPFPLGSRRKSAAHKKQTRLRFTKSKTMPLPPAGFHFAFCLTATWVKGHNAQASAYPIGSFT